MWGGASITNPDAAGSPFPSSAQVLTTPLVANLDDDNSDGVISDADIPEIIFISYCGTQFTQDGVLRAIHGGGPQRGADFFATCGASNWKEGEALFACSCATADLSPRSGLAVGDIDGDGIPEIVALTEASAGLVQVRVYSNTGAILTTSIPINANGNNPVPAIANLDNTGFAEIIVGRHVFTLHKPGGALQFLDHFEGTLRNGINGTLGPISCVANLTGDTRLEIVGGTTLYTFPRRPAGLTSRSQCTGAETGEEADWCQGVLPIVWDGVAVNGPTAVTNEGFCAIADVWGANPQIPAGPNNPLDGNAEVITVSAGFLQIFKGQTGVLLIKQTLNAVTLGGAPTVADFDGDGLPEIGVAGSTVYAAVDLQQATAQCPAWPNAFVDSMGGLQGNSPRSPPAAACTRDSDCGDLNQFACNEALSKCVCLHNGWRRVVEDDASRATGSSAFDFNGDHTAEVLYNDECYLRVYAGLDGAVLLKRSSPSRTQVEYPAVADVDNDGAAEFIFASNNESEACSGGSDFPNGITVMGDANGVFRPARRAWNQHTYHVTNTSEVAGVPIPELDSWRRDNTYRANACQQGPLCPYTCADFNGDGRIDLLDFAILARCFDHEPPWSQACACADMNTDATVDLLDYNAFPALMASSSVHFPPNCP